MLKLQIIVFFPHFFLKTVDSSMCFYPNGVWTFLLPAELLLLAIVPVEREGGGGGGAGVFLIFIS